VINNIAISATAARSVAAQRETTMSIRNMLIATALAFASVTTAHADGLRPIEAKSIDLASPTTRHSMMGFMSSRL